jgi:uncharacterized protein YukE
MGPTPTRVETQALRTAAQSFQTSSQALHDRAVPAIGRTGLPSFSVPAMSMGYGHNYDDARSAMDLTCKLGANVLSTISLALTRVANHYEGQDGENAKMFGGNPIPPPALPGKADLSSDAGWLDDTIASLMAIGEGGAVSAMIAVALAGLGTSSARAGGAAIIAPFGVFCLANLRDPVPHFLAASGWNEVEGVLADLFPELQKQVHDVTATAKWQGDGANSFNDYVTNIFAPMIDSARSLAGDMKTSSYEAGGGLSTALLLFIIATYTAITTCLEANADPTGLAGTAIIWATMSMWATFILEIIGEMIATFAMLGIASATIASGYKSLAGWLKDSDGSLDGKSANLSVDDTTTIQDWNQWTE